MSFGIGYFVPLKSFHFVLLNSVMSLPKGSLNKPTGALINLMNQLNNFTDDKKENELNLPNRKYRDIYNFQNLSRSFKRKTLSFFHTNVSSLNKNFDDFNVLLNDLMSILIYLQLQNHALRKFQVL